MIAMPKQSPRFLWASFLCVTLAAPRLSAAPEENPPGSPQAAQATQVEVPPGYKALSPTLRVDLKNKKVELDAEIVFREGPLELLVCPSGTKEHESVLAAEVQPRAFQTALLLAGAEPGHPAEFDPYKPPAGDHLRITARYTLAGQKKEHDARLWVRDLQRKQVMSDDFVFAGSRFVRIPGTPRVSWLGDEGDLVCVANFPGSIVDIARKSSRDNTELLFDANTPEIPPVGTKVTLVFEPIRPAQDKVAPGGNAEPAPKSSPPE